MAMSELRGAMASERVHLPATSPIEVSSLAGCVAASARHTLLIFCARNVFSKVRPITALKHACTGSMHSLAKWMLCPFRNAKRFRERCGSSQTDTVIDQATEDFKKTKRILWLLHFRNRCGPEAHTQVVYSARKATVQSTQQDHTNSESSLGTR